MDVASSHRAMAAMLNAPWVVLRQGNDVMASCPSCSSMDLDPVEGGASREVRCRACGHAWVLGGGAVGEVRYPARPANAAAVTLFESDDEAYIRWSARHAGGYVINTYRPPSATYLYLHQAGCFHITVPDASYTSQSWTGNEYMKACAMRRLDLEEWARQNFGREPDRCKDCAP